MTMLAAPAVAVLATLAATPLEAAPTGFWSMLRDPQQIALATLIACGAIFVGFMVRRMWPRSMNPLLFGWVAAMAVVAALAYIGIPSAYLVLWLFIAAAVLLGILALVLG